MSIDDFYQHLDEALCGIRDATRALAALKPSSEPALQVKLHSQIQALERVLADVKELESNPENTLILGLPIERWAVTGPETPGEPPPGPRTQEET